ncbi:MAG: hypothetical protein IJ080_01970 [Oscillospiraceae bacterium]|nr:hypothetical protein [Oscillospiraceae bacterium]
MLKFLSPFASDISGAVSVLYEMGGITVICDAGGCTGNVCGFDETRTHIRSAVFSAGLRDMDAVMGCEDRLADKIVRAYEQIGGKFIALVGTPVPSLIALDMRYTAKVTASRTGKPCIHIPSTGTAYYDKGQEAAYLKLFSLAEGCKRRSGETGIIGCTPLDTNVTADDSRLIFGMGSGFDEVMRAAGCERFTVVSPSGTAAAEYMKDRFGIPYDVGYPFDLPDVNPSGKVLVIHQQFAANALRERTGGDVASPFMMLPDHMRDGDRKLRDEDDLRETVIGYDTVIADETYRRAVPDFSGKWIDFPHRAVR